MNSNGPIRTAWQGSLLRSMWRRFKRAGYKWAISLFVVLMAFAALRELTGIPSLASLLACYAPGLYQELRSMVNAQAVIKVGEVVGVCSLIVTRIFTVLGEKELGFRYAELLPKLRPGYHILLLTQISALVASMWFTEADVLEAGLWATAIVLVGNIIQWSTLTDLTLYSELRTQTAIKLWQECVNGSQTTDRLGVVIRDLAQQLCYDVRNSYGEMEKALAMAMDRYFMLCEEKIPLHGWRDLLQELAGFWFHLLKDRQEEEQTLAAVGILQKCAVESEMPLCAGYFLWYHNTNMTNVDSDDAAIAAINGMIEKKDLLVQRFTGIKDKARIAQYAEGITASLAQMYFWTGLANLSVDIAEKLEEFSEEEQQILSALVRIFFTEDSYNRHWNTVMGAVFKSDEAPALAGRRA